MKADAMGPRWPGPRARLASGIRVVTLPRSVWVLALAGAVALAVLLINETSYARSMGELSRLELRAQATLQIQSLLRRMIDAETGERGYLLTGRPIYLAPYQQATADVQAGLDWLGRYYANDPVALAWRNALAVHVDAKLAELAAAVAAYDAGDRERWMALFEDGSSLRHMAAVRDFAERILEHERRLVAAERKAVLETLRTSRIGVNATATVGILALLMVLRQSGALDAIRRRHTEALQAERERLDAEVQRRTADLTEIARHLQTVREDESSRLARKLHEELGVLLTTSKMDVARLRHAMPAASPELRARLAHLDEGIDSCIALKRRIIEGLRPYALTNLGLVPALVIQLRDFAERTQVAVEHELDDVPLNDAGEITVYRLLQEALTNVAKYANARSVKVSLRQRGDEGDAAQHALFVVADDGRGFDARAPQRAAHGLFGMRYRVEAVGGELRVRSAPGQGTRIEATLPLKVVPRAGEAALGAEDPRK